MMKKLIKQRNVAAAAAAPGAGGMMGGGSFDDGMMANNPTFAPTMTPLLGAPRASIGNMTMEEKKADPEWRRMRRLLEAFYEKHDPTKLEQGIENVVDIGLQYGLPALSESLIKKYGEDLTDQIACEGDLVRMSIKKKLTDFYSKHDPSWVLVSTMVSAGLVDNGPIEDLVEWGYHHGYDRLNAKLVKKYGEGLKDLALPVAEIMEDPSVRTRPLYLSPEGSAGSFGMVDAGSMMSMDDASNMGGDSGVSAGVRRVRYNGGDGKQEAPRRKPKHKLKLPTQPPATSPDSSGDYPFKAFPAPPGTEQGDESPKPTFDIKRRLSDAIRRSLGRDKPKEKGKGKKKHDKPSRTRGESHTLTEHYGKLPTPVNQSVAPPSGKPCQFFKLDITATEFNKCYCGFSKVDHEGGRSTAGSFGSFADVKLKSARDRGESSARDRSESKAGKSKHRNEKSEKEKSRQKRETEKLMKYKANSKLKGFQTTGESVFSEQSEVGDFLQGFNLEWLESSLEKLGVERLEDLEYLEEDDASQLDLKPVQMRKLLKAVHQLRRQSRNILES